MKETTEYIALLQAWATTERQRRGPGAGLRVFVIDGAFATFIGCHRAPVLTCAMRPPSVLAQVLKQTGPGHEEEPTARNTQGNAIPAERSVDRTLAGEPGACVLVAFALRGLGRRASSLSLFPPAALPCRRAGKLLALFFKLNSFPGPVEFFKGWSKARGL